MITKYTIECGTSILGLDGLGDVARTLHGWIGGGGEALVAGPKVTVTVTKVMDGWVVNPAGNRQPWCDTLQELLAMRTNERNQQ